MTGKNPQEIYVTPSILATYFDMVPNSITRLANAGLPKASRGRYPLFACIRWYLSSLEARAIESPSELRDERRKLITAQRIGQELNNAKTRSELLDADLVATTMQMMLARITAPLDALPLLAPQLALLRDPGEIAKVVYAATRRARIDSAASMRAVAKSLADGNA